MFVIPLGKDSLVGKNFIYTVNIKKGLAQDFSFREGLVTSTIIL